MTLGDLGKGQPRLQLWWDRFTGHSDRKLWACFRSEDRRQMVALTRRVDKDLVPCRVISHADVADSDVFKLNEPLKRREFYEPILEKYVDGETFLGIYDHTRPDSAAISHRFITLAAGFFESVARSMDRAKPEDESHEAYPQLENRKIVASHLRRERSSMLAAARKQQDNYECQVCGFRFSTLYGSLGEEFAEAHHRVPLYLLRENIRTRVEDLATVCANCHRMLHKMDGKRDDLVKLGKIVQKHRQGRRK